MLKDCPLGQKTTYIETYTPDLLYPIPRIVARDKADIPSPLPFDGVDVWNGYEISWLTPSGKPQIALGELFIPCRSPNIVESKSLKLYLNSFNQSTFSSLEEVRTTIEKDLSLATQSSVTFHLFELHDCPHDGFSMFEGVCLDSLEIATDTYHVEPKFLTAGAEIVEEQLYSNLLKSNCLATGQPDWGSLYVHYLGPKIDHGGLLKYIISFRNHSGFAEHCVEQIFCEIKDRCRAVKLTVYARYTRRGGLDINPFRSNFQNAVENFREVRQ